MTRPFGRRNEGGRDEGHDADTRPAFVEGAILGAIIGAAIAGSTLWARWRERRPTVGPRSGSATIAADADPIDGARSEDRVAARVRD